MKNLVSTRSMLRHQLRSAWRRTIEDYYQYQRINSEGGLQAFFCAALMEEFDQAGIAHRRRIFVEPCLTVGKGRAMRMPDILICNTRSAIGVVELKYKPKTVPDTRKDMETLEWIAEHPKGVRVRNDRYTGVLRDNRQYPFVGNAVLCWAGVHRGMSEPVKNRLRRKFRSSFIEMHAITEPNADPVILC